MAMHSKEARTDNHTDSSMFPHGSIGGDEARLVRLPMGALDPDPNQPRTTLGDVTDLALSIRQHGLLNPIIVEATAAGRYRILAGGRRFSACKRLGMDAVDCIVRTVEEQARLALQLIENMHRKDLSPVEEARGMRRLMEEFNLTQRDLAQQVGKSVASVNQTLRVLDLDPTLLASVQTSEWMSKSVLLEIAKETDPQRQRDLWDQARAGRLTVREARATKVRPPSARSRLVTIPLPDASVAVRVRGDDVSPERIVDALRCAIARFTAAPVPGSET